MKFEFTPNSIANVHKFDTLEELAKELVPDLTSGSVGLSGGSTYSALFDEWTKLKVDLSRNWYCAVDERDVPFEDEQSNWGTATRKLFTPLGFPELGNNNYSTAAYFERMLQNRFNVEPFIFDTIFLGVGDDGHTASIFPEPVTQVRYVKGSTLETKSPKGIENRTTLSMKPIRDAKKVVMIITGEGKEQCIEWLKKRRRMKPFVHAMMLRETTELYLDSKLYDLFLREDDE